MGLTKKIKKYLAGAAFAGAVLASQPNANADEARQPSVQQIQTAARNAMRDEEQSFLPAAEGMRLNFGNGTDDYVFNYLYRVSGRVRWAQTYPNSRFGHHRDNSRNLRWRRHDSSHYSFFTTDNFMLSQIVPLAEEAYEDFSSRMHVNTFNEKIRVHLFNDRIAFEQMGMFPGMVPEGLGGITEIREKMHNKVVFLNEGEREFLYHVGRHELAHRFRMEQFRNIAHDDLTNEFPLWFIEGIAEHDSLRTSSSIDASVRDAYFNGFLELGLSPMLEGTRFMYDAGSVYVNYIGDNFGEEALNRIVTNGARGLDFNRNIRRVTGISMDTLSRRVNENLANKFGNQFSRNGIEDRSRPLGENVIMASNKEFFVLGRSSQLQDSIYLAKRVNGEWVEERLDSDQVPGTDSLHRFRSGADINDGQVAYVARDGVHDIIRINNFSFEHNDFNVRATQEFGFDDITFIENPRLIDRTKMAFVGMMNGFTDIYLFDKGNNHLSRITNNMRGVRGMDYNHEKNSLVFSLESEERTSNPSRCDFNYDLYEISLDDMVQRRLTETDYDETNPSVSPDGNRLVYNTDRSGSKDLALYDYTLSRELRLPRSRVAASSPAWRSNTQIVFTSVEMMGPKSFSFTIDNSVNILNNSLRAGNNSRPGRSSSRLGNINFSNGRISVQHNNNAYSIDTMINTGHELYMHGSSRNGSNNIFAMRNNSGIPLVRNARPSLESMLNSNSRARNAVDNFRDSHTVISSVLSPDEDFIAFAVNNRLSMHDPEYRSDFPVAFYLYDVNADRMNKLPDISMNNTDNLEAMMPLMDGRILVYNTNNRMFASPEDHYRIYEPANNRFREIHSQLMTVDRNRRFIMGLSDNDRLFVYDSDNGSMRNINLSIRGYDKLNITQTSSGDFLIREEGAHNNCKHYHLLNPETGQVTSRNLSRFLRNRVVQDMSRLDDGKLAITTNRIIRVTSSGLLGGLIDFGATYVNDRTANEFYVEDNHRFRRRLKQFRKVEMLATDGSTLLLKGSTRRRSKYIALNGETFTGDRLEDSELDSSSSNLAYSDGRTLNIFNMEHGNVLSISNVHGFDVSGTKIAYATYRGGNFDVHERDLRTGRVRRVAESRLNEFMPRYTSSGLQFETESQPMPETTRMISRNYSVIDLGIEQESITRLPIDYMQLSALGGFSTTSKFLIADFTSTDMLEERIFNLSYFGNFDDGMNFGSASYVDRSSNFGISSYVQQISGNTSAGLGASLIFPQSRFSQFDLSLGYEYQNIKAFDYKGINHIVRMGTGYGYDSSLYGIHGPRDGSRLSVNFNLGFSLNNQEMSNADIYLAGRKYINFCDYAYLALAGDAGTSQGRAPTLILNGGNMSLRGVNFGELLGNNIAMARSEFRLNIIQAAGIQLVKPIEGLSILSITPIPEIGWYNDIGATWYHNSLASYDANAANPFKLYYSGGPTINLTTFLGLVARFNFPLYGSPEAKEWNFWLGYVGSNW